MLLGEPAPTQADVHFQIFGIPVRVHPLFWVVSLLLGMGGRQAHPRDALIWIAVVFVSILVHELGHAAMQRYYGGHPHITLYSFGGLASCSDCRRTPGAQILILLAGPFAGFFLAAFVVSVLVAMRRFDGFVLDWVPVRWELFDLEYFFQTERLAAPDELIWDLLQVNILWGLLNLLPIYPLDGGQISRELFSLANPRAGITQSLQLSAGVAVLVAVYAILNQRIFTGIMFGILAYESFQALQAYRSHWR
jgi:stage IV sporulation protein FB